MPYNLEKYKFQIGDRVMIVSPDGTPKNAGTLIVKIDDEIVALWNYGVGNTGVIVDVVKYGVGNTPPWIKVRPDAELGFGIHVFEPKELRTVN